MRHRMAKTHLATCRHEAAHTILAERFGWRVLSVHAPKKTPHEGGRGVTVFGSPRKIGPVQVWCVMMAGSVAEHLWHGTPKGLASENDHQDMLATGMRGEDFRIVWEETSRLVRRLKPEIWSLAKQLQAGKRVKR